MEVTILELDKKWYELCKKYVMPLFEGNAEKIIFDDDKQTVTVPNDEYAEFENAADEAIIEYGMTRPDYEMTELGYDLQGLYDEMYYQVTHK